MITPKILVTNLLASVGYQLVRINADLGCTADVNQLAKATSFIERFREIVSDPLNLLIERCPQAGYVDAKKNIILHNGIRVPAHGADSYYGRFSDILVINRGVHEPLEEYCFQEVIKQLRATGVTEPAMLELGAYWGHYSMWFKSSFPLAHCFLVEPEPMHFQSGIHNFSANDLRATFINQFVSADAFTVDKFFSTCNAAGLDILHSDIQGYELQMLENASKTLASGLVKYIFLSTHSEKIHSECAALIGKYDYRIEVSSGFDHHTTSSDGFLLASSNLVSSAIPDVPILGRIDIANSTSSRLLGYLNTLHPMD